MKKQTLLYGFVLAILKDPNLDLPPPLPAPTPLFVATPLLFELFLFHKYLYLVMLLLFSVPFFYLDA